MQNEIPKLVLIIGYSGAGLGTAIKAFEDIGFYCVDNLPLELVKTSHELIKENIPFDKRGVAFGLHLFSKNHVQNFQNLVAQLKKENSVEVVFLTADAEILAIRFNATRRRHPMRNIRGELAQSILMEKDLIGELIEFSDVTFDTSSFSPQDLQRQIEARYSSNLLAKKLNVTLVSFGFKHGPCRSLDTMHDVRFLPNPYFIQELKAQSGLDAPVQDYIWSFNIAQDFFTRLENWYDWLFPKYVQEGKHYMRIGIGCTGGQHRSVTVAEKLFSSKKLNKIDSVVLEVEHRDFKRL